MSFFNNKEFVSRKDLEKVLAAQESKMRSAQWDREKKLIDEFENKMHDLREDNEKRIEQICEEHNSKLRTIQFKKLESMKELVKDKDAVIGKLEKENIDLLKKTRRYKEAYELYRENRNRIIELAREMGLISDRVTMTAAKMNTFFAQISDLAESNMRVGLILDPKVEALMYVDEPTHEETHLRLIEKKLEKEA